VVGYEKALDAMEVIMIHSLNKAEQGRSGKDQRGWMGVLHCKFFD